MANYTFTRRGVVTCQNPDTSPKDVTLPSAIKNQQSFRVVSVREIRRKVSAQRGSVALTSVDTSPKDIAITSVDLATAEAKASFKQKRTNGNDGITWKLQSATVLRLTFDAIAAGDTVDVEWEVIEHKPATGATARILNDTTLRVEWDGTLATGESIVVAYEAVDVEDLRADVKAVLFGIQRQLGFAGENSLQDLMDFDQAGNPVIFRIRTFDSKADMLAATKDVPDGDPLEAGELSRVKVNLAWSTAKNRTKSITSQLDELADVPGI